MDHAWEMEDRDLDGLKPHSSMPSDIGRTGSRHVRVRRRERGGPQPAHLAEDERDDARAAPRTASVSVPPIVSMRMPPMRLPIGHEAKGHDPRGARDPPDELVRGVRGPDAHVDHDKRRLAGAGQRGEGDDDAATSPMRRWR